MFDRTYYAMHPDMMECETFTLGNKDCLYVTMGAKDIEFSGNGARFYLVSCPAHMLGIGRSKFYELVGEGAIETVKVGRSTLVPVESLMVGHRLGEVPGIGATTGGPAPAIVLVDRRIARDDPSPPHPQSRSLVVNRFKRALVA